MKRGINIKMSNTPFRVSFAVLYSRIGTRLTSKPPPPPPPPPRENGRGRHGCYPSSGVCKMKYPRVIGQNFVKRNFYFFNSILVHKKKMISTLRVLLLLVKLSDEIYGDPKKRKGYIQYRGIRCPIKRFSYVSDVNE